MPKSTSIIPRASPPITNLLGSFVQARRTRETETGLNDHQLDSIARLPEISVDWMPHSAHSETLPLEFEIDDSLQGNFQDEAIYPMPGGLDMTTGLSQDQLMAMDSTIFNDLIDTASPPPRSPTSWPWVTSNSVLSSGYGDEDTTLLMHYLDEVFYVQFPFYDRSRIDGGRGWLLRLLTRDTSVYHSTLALSEFHRDSIRPQEGCRSDEPGCSREKKDYFTLSLRELQQRIGESETWKGTAGLFRSIDALACALQLLFLEVRSSGFSFEGQFD